MFGGAYGSVVQDVISVTKRQVVGVPAILSTCGAGGLILWYTFVLLLNNPIVDSTSFASGFVVDSLGTQCKLIMVCGGFLSMTVSQGVMSWLGAFESVCLMLWSMTGGMLVISSGDLMSLFLCLEIQSLCFYVLASTGRTSEFSTEGGLKYLVLGAFSSGVLLFGSCLLYGFSGTTSLYEVSNLALSSGGDVGHMGVYSLGRSVGLMLILFGVLFKLGAAPFHSWVPDVYDGSPVFITTFFAAVPKVAILAFVLRLFVAFGLASKGHLFTSILSKRVLGGMQYRVFRAKSVENVGEII